MLETLQDAKLFFSENQEGDWIVHAVPVEDGRHPSDNSICILFIRNISTGKTYYYACNHPDSTPQFSIRPFLRQAWFHMPQIKTKWALDSKVFHQLTGLSGVRDVNLHGYLEDNVTLDLKEYETSAHFLVRQNSHGISKINRSIPLMKHLEAFDDMCYDVERVIKNFKMTDAFTKFNDIIYTLGKIEKNGIHVDPILFQKHFNTSPNEKGLVFSEYNVYTSTGRPSNRYGGINYAALNHTDGSRSCFTSRYGKDGCMVVIDYTAFHPRIICQLTDYPLPVTTDIYEYLAKLYFQKKDVDETDVANAKKLTFRQLYGGVEDEYVHIKYLANLKTFIDEQWAFFQKNGYIKTPFFKRHITDKHIQDPNPTKLFNYILQAVEGEVAIPKIQRVLNYLSGFKTKAVLYTYDAVLYDFHREDGIEVLKTLQRIMSYDGAYPMKTYIGNSYQDLRLITV